jgi:tetratricopeptide (TPR) repeat protein
VRLPFFGGLAHLYGDDPLGAEAALARVRAVLSIPLRELNRPVAEADLDPHVLFLRAAYDFQVRKQNQSAVEQLTRVRMRNPRFYPASVSSLLFKALLAWGADFERRGEIPQAIAKTLQAKEEARYDLDPKRRDLALRNLAQYYRFADQWTDAQAVALDLVARYPKDAVIRYVLASVFADQLQFDKAVEQWKACLDLLAHGDVPKEDAEYLDDALMRYGISLASDNQIEAGIATLREFAEKHPKDARPHFYLGRILWDQSRAREARDELEKAVALDSLCGDMLALLITVYDAGGQDLGDDAAKVAKRLAELRAMTTDEAKKARQEALLRRQTRHNDRSYGCH